MQQELLAYFQDEKAEPGLLLIPAPTGYGKTFRAIQAIYAYLQQGGTRRILFTTPLLKNLPEKELRRAYAQDGRADAFDREVLVLRSTSDTVAEAILTQDIPEKFQTDAYRKLREACRKRRSERNRDYAEHLTRDIRNELEPDFRRELVRTLNKAFPRGPEQRREGIRKNKQFQWIRAFYPAVFWDEYKVILLSVRKLLTHMVTLVERPFPIVSDRVMAGAILCIDEFDAAREDMLSGLIENSLALRADYLKLFLQVYNSTKTHRISRELSTARDRCEKNRSFRWQDLLDEAESIYQYGALCYSMKTADVAADCGRSFLFHDSSYHTVLDGGRTHIRAVRDDELAQVLIHFETRDVYRAHEDEPNISLQNLLRRIRFFLLRFRRYVYSWAEVYAAQCNTKRRSTEDLLTVTYAAESIFRDLGLSPEQVKLLLGTLEENAAASHRLTAPDLSFYESGFRLFEFIDDERHRTQTHLQYWELQTTPEKVLLTLCRRAKVVGLSATACLPTVLGNFDLRYLQEQLRDNYRTLSDAAQAKIRSEMETLWQPYRTGAIRTTLDIVDRGTAHLSLRERLAQIFPTAQMARQYEQRMTAMGLTDYESARYCNLFTVMKAFWQHTDIHALLCLNQLLPGTGKAALDYPFLCDAMNDLHRTYAPDAEGELAVLRSGSGFETDKQALQTALSCGGRRFILSCYQTLGAGQNLQYPVTDRTGLVPLHAVDDGSDSRFCCADVDALYLGDVTHSVINLNGSEKPTPAELMRYCFQVECLYQNDELSYQTLHRLLQDGVRWFAGQSGRNSREQNALYRCRSLQDRVTRDVVQAVGRMDRTFLKRPNIRLFTTGQVLQNLDADALDGLLLCPEAELLARECRALRTAAPQTDAARCEAERISTRGSSYIMRMLSGAWTRESIDLWRALRQTVLRCPRADAAQYRTDPVIRTFYIPLDPAHTAYWYAQKGDFSEVFISAGQDRTAFAAALPEDLSPAEVSEEDARLPVILQYPGMRAHFAANGWATAFGRGAYCVSPVLFQNIYKGALGEAAGAFILEQEFGLSLQEIDDPDTFEKFDFTAGDGVYVDFKHWKPRNHRDEEAQRRRVLDKLDAVGGRRALLINLIAAPDAEPACTTDERLVEIPGLLLPDGTPDRRALTYLARYLL